MSASAGVGVACKSGLAGGHEAIMWPRGGNGFVGWGCCGERLRERCGCEVANTVSSACKRVRREINEARQCVPCVCLW